MVVISDKILRIVAPSGRPAIAAALAKLVQQENGIKRQLSETKGDPTLDEARRSQEVRRLEANLKEVLKQMEPLKAQLEDLKAQEDKEAEARAVVRETRQTGRSPYTRLMTADLSKLAEE